MSDQKVGDRLGFACGYGPRFGISTSISESGIGHGGECELWLQDDMSIRHGFHASGHWMRMGSKLFPQGGEGARYDTDVVNIQAGLSRFKRKPLLSASGEHEGSLTTGTVRTVGGSITTLHDPALDVDGGDFAVAAGEANDAGITMANSVRVGAELHPWHRNGPLFRIITGLDIYARYAGDKDINNRVSFEIPILLELGWVDDNLEPAGDKGTERSIEYQVYGGYAKVHQLLMRSAQYAILNKANQTAQDSGLVGRGSPGGQEDIRFLQTGAAFVDAAGQGDSQLTFLTAGEIGEWIFLGLEGVGGGISLAAGPGVAGRSAGVSDLLSTGGMGLAIAYKVATPQQRARLSEEELVSRFRNIALLRYAAGAVVFGGGAIASRVRYEGDPTELDGERIAMGGGVQALAGLSITPDSLDTGLIASTDVSYIPFAYQFSDRLQGSRGGILIHKNFADSPLYTEARALSHAATPVNLVERIAADEPLSDTSLPSEVTSTLGLELETTYFRAGLGLDTAIYFGPGDRIGAAGLSGGFDIRIPFSGKRDGGGVIVGVRGAAHLEFPEGHKFEIIPHIGGTF